MAGDLLDYRVVLAKSMGTGVASLALTAANVAADRA